MLFIFEVIELEFYLSIECIFVNLKDVITSISSTFSSVSGIENFGMASS